MMSIENSCMPDHTGRNALSRQYGSFSGVNSFISPVADRLRDRYQQAECGKVFLPPTALRSLDCVFGDSLVAVSKKAKTLKGFSIKDPEESLNRAAKPGFRAEAIAVVPRGDCQLVWSLVIEDVFWFENRGVPPAIRTIRVIDDEPSGT